ncbi:hypothetical protein HNR46_002347 [Haloferula luteola]|uniref:Uncharacterized protein n=1 Tax=Haloferula luteola TaxID=595692 RepID=A0A840V4Z0_9BACT|nr:hypothetical protein [Haloferula luteola]MBB5352106.1 hypothetical protein [Haloferula luteola]
MTPAIKLPDKTAERLLTAISTKPLLEKSAAAEVIDALKTGKPVNWNLVLTKQFESEQGGRDEAES